MLRHDRDIELLWLLGIDVPIENGEVTPILGNNVEG